MQYFAYGSNLSLARLRARVPSARRIGSYRLAGHQLRFHKAGRDGSAKCDIHFTGNPRDSVFGALFSICPGDKQHLDRAEGLGVGYAEKTVWLHGAGGGGTAAFTYYALQVDPCLRPYGWYLEHVLRGAREARLPWEYVHGIAAVEAIDDPDHARDARERAVHARPVG